MAAENGDHVVELVVHDTSPSPSPSPEEIIPLLNPAQKPKINIFTISYPRTKTRVLKPILTLFSLFFCSQTSISNSNRVVQFRAGIGFHFKYRMGFKKNVSFSQRSNWIEFWLMIIYACVSLLLLTGFVCVRGPGRPIITYLLLHCRVARELWSMDGVYTFWGLLSYAQRGS